MRRFFISAVIILVSTFSLFAEDTDWYIGKPIEAIDFYGLKNIDINELTPIIDQFIGKEFTDTLFWDLQSKLYALNYFDSFDANAEPADESKSSLIIEFTVTERPLIGSINFKGNKSVSRSKLLDTIVIKKDDFLNNVKIRMDETAIKELYIEEGFPDVVVESSSEESNDKGFIDLYFNITEGQQSRIEKIAFSGNSFASENTLKRQLKSKEQGIFNNGIFQESYIEEDKAAIIKYYSDSGYIDAKITDVIIEKIEKDDDQDTANHISMTFYIDEGDLWLFGGYTLEGNTLFTTEELLDKAASKIGKSINSSQIQSDILSLSDSYYNEGYIYNEIRPSEIRDKQKNTISYKISINEKSRAHIENIIVKGNEKTKDNVILREIPLEEGDIFSKSAVMLGLNNLNNTRYFSSVVPEMPYGSEMGLMDLIINVEEDNTTDIQFGVTFTATAGSIPIIGFLKWSDTNFLGTGRNINAGINISTKKQELSFGISDNWLFGERISGGVQFSISHDKYTKVPQDVMLPIFTIDNDIDDQVVPDPYDGHYVWAAEASGSHEAGEAVDISALTNDEINALIEDGSIITDYDYAIANDETIGDEYLMSYDSLEMSLSANGGYTFVTSFGRIALGMGIGPSLSYMYYDGSLYRAYDKDIRDFCGKIVLTDRLWITASWDTRDLIYSPTKGFIFKETITYSGGFVFGYNQFFKTKTDADAYFQLFDIEVTDSYNLSMVLGIHGQFSMILPQFGYMDTDGDGTEEWGTGLIATRNDLLYYDGMFLARGWGANYDNKALLDLVVDFTMPIAKGIISFNSFLSGTGVWKESDDFVEMSLNDYYFSMGAGLQLDIPSFPISLFVVKRAKFDANNNFNWQEGTYFINDNVDDSGIDLVVSFDLDYF